SAGGFYGSTLPAEKIATQLLATEAFLSSGIPFNVVTNPQFKDLLHHLGARVPGPQHLANHIPFVLAKEKKNILEDIGSSNYSFCSDETPRRGACFGIGIRFIKDDKIMQRVLSLSFLDHSMDYRATNGEVMNIAVDEYKLDRARCGGFMLDGCAANLKALDALLINFPKAVGVRCFSHLLNNCGNELDSEEIDNFAGHLHVLLAHSLNASELWSRETGRVKPKPASHRWSSRF
ncbi:unnamed protein product, partial [Hapterophycus canaliculatus]